MVCEAGVALKKKKSPEVNGDRPAAPRRARTRKVSSPPVAPTQEDVAYRAYLLFVQRGGEHGHDWEDWLLAERELGLSAS